jgi:biotin transport system substrate-specific component
MKIKTRDMILTALFAALTAIGALIRIPIPISPVPITLQDLFTVLSGILLGPFLGSLSQLLYVILGLFGLPVFASGNVGISAILSPSFGYLIGFIISPIIIGIIISSKNNPSFLRILLATAVGLLAIYMIGIPYMFIILHNVQHINITLIKALQIGFFIFLPGDIIKCVAATALGFKLIPILKRYR